MNFISYFDLSHSLTDIYENRTRGICCFINLIKRTCLRYSATMLLRALVVNLHIGESKGETHLETVDK